LRIEIPRELGVDATLAKTLYVTNEMWSSQIFYLISVDSIFSKNTLEPIAQILKASIYNF
jgi:hypothetical protein